MKKFTLLIPEMAKNVVLNCRFLAIEKFAREIERKWMKKWLDGYQKSKKFDIDTILLNCGSEQPTIQK